MIIGVLKEVRDTRVALVPNVVKKLIAANNEVWVENGAGEQAFFTDDTYQKAGATIKNKQAILPKVDLLIAIQSPDVADLQQCKPKTVILSMFQPYNQPSIVEELKKLHFIAFSLDMIPRSSLAQSVDILSSMASMAGYKAVVIAANHLPRYFPMLITSAGSIPPAKALILGAGVAGLQAIATAKRLGAKVEAFDVRAAAKEEVESLGAKFVEVEGAKDDKGAGGYAVQQTEAYKKRQKELIHERASKSDIIITTAQLRGRKAPILIEERTIKAMKKGSVIIDLASSTGGNCAIVEDDKTIQYQGVTIVGNSALAATMPVDASQLFSNNMFNFLKWLIKEGKFTPDLANEVVTKSCITDNLGS